MIEMRYINSILVNSFIKKKRRRREKPGKEGAIPMKPPSPSESDHPILKNPSPPKLDLIALENPPVFTLHFTLSLVYT